MYARNAHQLPLVRGFVGIFDFFCVNACQRCKAECFGHFGELRAAGDKEAALSRVNDVHKRHRLHSRCINQYVTCQNKLYLICAFDWRQRQVPVEVTEFVFQGVRVLNLRLNGYFLCLTQAWYEVPRGTRYLVY